MSNDTICFHGASLAPEMNDKSTTVPWPPILVTTSKAEGLGVTILVTHSTTPPQNPRVFSAGSFQPVALIPTAYGAPMNHNALPSKLGYRGVTKHCEFETLSSTFYLSFVSEHRWPSAY